MSILQPPTSFSPALTDDRLSLIASGLLDVRHKAQQEMIDPFDDNYSIETTIFARSKNMLIDMALNGGYEWLSLKKSTMDIEIEIGNTICRYFTDDHDIPKKDGFFKVNDANIDQLFPTDLTEAVYWRFVVEKARSEAGEDQVFFAGYNLYQQKISEWKYQPNVLMIHTSDQSNPAAVDIQPAFVDVREDDGLAHIRHQKLENDR